MVVVIQVWRILYHYHNFRHIVNYGRSWTKKSTIHDSAADTCIFGAFILSAFIICVLYMVYIFCKIDMSFSISDPKSIRNSRWYSLTDCINSPETITPLSSYHFIACIIANDIKTISHQMQFDGNSVHAQSINASADFFSLVSI